MDLVSIRMITDDLERVIQFYEQVTGVEAVRYTPVFAELIMPSFTLAIGHTQTTQLFGEGLRSPRRQPHHHHRVPRQRRRQRVRATQAAGQRLGAGAHHHALG